MAAKPKIPTESKIAQLPRWAQVAFAARCARRVFPLFRSGWKTAPEQHSHAIMRAIEVAESAATAAVSDVHTAYAAAAGADAAANAAEAADDADAAADAAAATAARAAYAAADGAAAAADAAAFAVDATDANADVTVRIAIRADFERLKRSAAAEHWTDETPIPPTVFGPLWPGGSPPGWPGASGGSHRAKPEIEPLVVVSFVEGDFTADEIALFLEHVSTTYREVGGNGLKVVKGQALVPAEGGVPQ